MTGMARQYGAINLSQGFPDWPAPNAVKAAAARAINADVNQYAITCGAKNLRDALSDFYRAKYALPVDAERELTVCCGATEASLAALLAVLLTACAVAPAAVADTPARLISRITDNSGVLSA